jgi:predicted nucleic acid-binding Zn ribbon protein
MPSYCFKCDGCNKAVTLTLRSWRDLETEHPSCEPCNAKMRRDYAEEHFGGITERSKGVYPIVTEDMTGEPIEVTSRSHENQLMRKYGLVPVDPSRESRYRVKHMKDIK